MTHIQIQLPQHIQSPGHAAQGHKQVHWCVSWCMVRLLTRKYEESVYIRVSVSSCSSVKSSQHIQSHMPLQSWIPLVQLIHEVMNFNRRENRKSYGHLSSCFATIKVTMRVYSPCVHLQMEG